MTGNTRAGSALDYINDNVLKNVRNGASQVIIVLTDGVSQDNVESAVSRLIGGKGRGFSKFSIIFCYLSE